MARKKKESAPPPAPVRPIHCGFCQKELDPAADQVTFIGVGKWRGGPGFVHAVCSAKTPEGEENPCFVSGMSWATNILKQQPVCMSYEQWKARPVRRHILATRAANGRYELQLSEAQLNCYYFLEKKLAPNADKAKEIVARWQSAWGLEPDDIPDIDKVETDSVRAYRAKQVVQNVPLDCGPSVKEPIEISSEAKREIRRHTDRHFKHSLKFILTNGDNCVSCRITRGMRKLRAISLWVPVLEQTLETMRLIVESGGRYASFMVDCRKAYDDALKSLQRALDLKPDDEEHNKKARRRNLTDIRYAHDFVEKHEGRR